MCTGYFRQRHHDTQPSVDTIPPGAPSTWWDKQVVLAGDDGYIYIMESETFQVFHMHALPAALLIPF